jgi:hypothetical protein
VYGVGWTPLILLEASPAASRHSQLAWGNATHGRGDDRRRFPPRPPPWSWGLALHARRRDVGLVQQVGDVLLPHHVHAAPAPVLKAITPDRGGLVGAVECLLP